VEELVRKASGFSEVFPEQKSDIVQLLRNGRSADCVVAMTGHSVNDVPALKAADLAITVGNSCDAARASSDLIILEHGLSPIVKSIRTARIICQRMRTYLMFRIAGSIQLFWFFGIAVIAMKPPTYAAADSLEYGCSLPGYFMLPAICVVLITVFNDISMFTLAYDRAIPSQYPSKWVAKEICALGFMLGCVAATSNLVLFWLLLDSSYWDSWFTATFFKNAVAYQETLTAVYLGTSLTAFLTVFTCRTGGRFWWRHAPCWQLCASFLLLMVITTVLCVTWPVFLTANQPCHMQLQTLPWRIVLFVWVWSVLTWQVQDLCKVIVMRLIAFARSKKENISLLDEVEYQGYKGQELAEKRSNLSSRTTSASQIQCPVEAEADLEDLECALERRKEKKGSSKQKTPGINRTLSRASTSSRTPSEFMESAIPDYIASSLRRESESRSESSFESTTSSWLVNFSKQ
jgi:H+-transporting ATPase